MNTEVTTLENGMIVEKTVRKYHIRMVFTDTEGQTFYVAYNVNKKQILTDFFTDSMKSMNFAPIPSTSKHHYGRFKYMYKAPESMEPDPNKLIPFETIIIPAVMSAGARTLTAQRKNAETIIRVAEDLRYAQGEEKGILVETIRQLLCAIEQNVDFNDYVPTHAA